MADGQLRIDTSAPARLGLARSRHATDNADQSKNKKQKTQPRSFAHAATTELPNKRFECKHCKEEVSSNITRRKAHLLKCEVFLGSQEAAQAAEKDPELRAAVDDYR